MKRKLYIVEGLPCSGKSSTAAWIAERLSEHGQVCLVDEGTLAHPADYEFHALAPAGFISEESCIVPLSGLSQEMFQKLLPYKIYDFLPWEVEMPLMLEKWRDFVNRAQENVTYVFNCVLLQNPMCETMMRFGFPEEASRAYIAQIAEIIAPLSPSVVYLKNTDIASSVRRCALERPNWLDGVIDYHVNGAYGKSIGAEGFDGYITCLRERQARELRILDALGISHLVLDDPQKDWSRAYARIEEFLT